MSLTEAFCTEIERFLKRSKMTPTVFGRLALDDPNFVFELRAGRDPKAATIDKVRDFIRSAKERSESAA